MVSKPPYDRGSSIIWKVCDLQYQSVTAAVPELIHIPAPFRRLVTCRLPVTNAMCIGEEVMDGTEPVEGSSSLSCCSGSAHQPVFLQPTHVCKVKYTL